jgi:hypothetical protein
MCPVCLASAAWIAASIATTGGLAAVVLKKTVMLKCANNPQPITPSQEDLHG